MEGGFEVKEYLCALIWFMPQESSIHFEISERKILLRLGDIFVILFFLHVIGLLWNFDYFQINESHWFWSIILAFYISLFGTIFEMYELRSASRINSTVQGVVFTASAVALVYLLTPIFTPPLPQNRLQILYFYLAIGLSLMIWRSIYILFIASSRFNKNILLVAGAEDAARMATTLSMADHNFKVVGFVNTDRSDTNFTGDKLSINEVSYMNVKSVIDSNKVSEIVVGSQDIESVDKELYNILINLVEQGYTIKQYTQVYEETTDRVPVQYIGKEFYRYFPFSRSNHNRLYKAYARTVDIIAALIGLTFLGLILPFILIGNMIGNRGSLFYTQNRVGKYGKLYKIYKLRSMVKDAERDGAKFATAGDARVTKFGKLLRKSRLDEIPQFINVIKGEMSLIGPRPERPMFVEELSNKIPFYQTRNVVKPGLTGWAQVKYAYGVTEEDHLIKLQYDLYYIKRRSVFLDIRIIVKTLSTVLFFKGQ